MARALILKFGAIGDVVMAIPAARLLHENGHEVVWICGQTVAPVLRLYPWITTIEVDDRRLLRGSKGERLIAMFQLWKAIPSGPYDVCATLYYDSRYKLLSLPVRAKRKVMLSHTDRATKLIAGRHHADEYARIVLGLPDSVTPQQLAPVRPAFLPENPLPRGKKPRVVLAPAGARNMMRDDALRRWPVESYVLLSGALLARGYEVVIAGGPDDAELRRALRHKQ